MEIREFQELVLEKAKMAGFQDCEIYYRSDEDFQASVREGVTEHYETSLSSGAAFRGVIDGRTGSAYTERFDEAAADFMVSAAKENAGVSEPEECIFFEGGDYSGEELYDPSLDGAGAEEKIKMLVQAERAALDHSPKIKGADSCVYGEGKTKISIMNTKGLNRSFETNGAVAYISVICAENDDIKTGGEYFSGSDLSLFDPAEMGRSAAMQAESMLGAASVKSGVYDIVFKNTAMASLLATFSSSFTGEQAYKGLSMLEGREGEKIASDCVTIRDDGLLRGGSASAVFDGEGVPCRNKTVVEKGVLKTLLYDLKYGALCGKESTGNGFRAGFRPPVSCAASNFYILPSDMPLEEVVAAAGKGIYITDVEGLHAGANTVSGDFSLSAQGYLIEEGRITSPVEQITVAANFFELLKNIEAVGNDLRFSMGGTGSPSALVKKVSVSGL